CRTEHLLIKGRNGTGSMPRLCVVILARESFDFGSILEPPLRRMGFDVEICRLPYFWLSSLTTARLSSLKQLLKQKSQGQFLIFIPDTSELFLKEPDLTIAFSGYRSWYDEQ